MKLRLTFLLCAVWCTALFAGEPLKFSVLKNSYALSTYYEFIGNDTYMGRAVKSSLRVRTCYDLYDAEGDCEGEGICRALSLGAFYSWAREIDIYDASGYKIGMVDGKMLSMGRAKFTLYGEDGELTGVAYLDNEGANFTLYNNGSYDKTLGHVKRVLSAEGNDTWEVSLYDPTAIETRLLKVFAAFIVDNQDHF